MKLPLVYYGNSLLRKRAVAVKTITEDLRKLAKEMVETMDGNSGIGLAAPQVGHGIRLFVLRNYEETPEGHLTLTEPQVYINPKLIEHSDEIQVDIEGCLSIPGIRAEVTRPFSVTVEAMNLDGELFVERVEGYKARVIMHENDHLNGVLFIDRLEPSIRKQLDPALKDLKKKYN